MTIRGMTAFSGVLVAVTLTVSGTARADAAGDKVLAAMDAAMNRAKTLTFEYEITNQESGKAAKKMGAPSEIQYFNAAGTNIKTETRSQYTCEGNVCSPTELKMVDNTRGNWTQLVRKSWKVNEAIADTVFSTRSLGE